MQKWKTRKSSIALLAALGTAMLPLPVSAQEKTIVVSGSGGVVAEANSEIFIPAFTEATGWSVQQVSAEGRRVAQIEAMVRAGQTTWDISEISASDYPIAVGKGLLEPIDYSIVDPDGELPEAAKKEFGVVAASYSTVLVQRLDKNPDGKKMESWADFWDVETFPGPRSLNAKPAYNLEFALLADGVPKGEIYDLLSTEEGLDRAFAKMDEIRDHIPVWWESGAQSVQLLSDGEVFYSTTYNGRVAKLQESGIPAEIVWNGGALHLSHVGIPKGAPNVEAANEYIRIRTARADLERKYLEILPYPNFSPGLFDGMSAEIVATMPTSEANAAAQFEANEQFWAENLKNIQERWDEWLLQ